MRQTCAVNSTRNDSSGPSVPLRRTHPPVSACAEAEPAVQDVVGLGDELHVAVLDAVVDHLDEVPGAVGTDVRDARPGFRLARRSLRARRRDPRHASFGPPGHDRRAEARALPRRPRRRSRRSACRMLAQRGLAAACVLEPGVAAVDQDVARVRASGVSLSIISSTGAPAGIIIMIRRGRSSAAANCSKRRRAVELRARMLADEVAGPVCFEVPDRDADIRAPRY